MVMIESILEESKIFDYHDKTRDFISRSFYRLDYKILVTQYFSVKSTKFTVIFTSIY